MPTPTRPADPDRDAFIRLHYKADMTAAQIAQYLGISRNTVIGIARDLGLCNSSRTRVFESASSRHIDKTWTAD